MSDDENLNPRPYPLSGSTRWHNQRAREESERAIGRICMAFQQLEESVSSHIARLISRDLHLGTIITAEFSFRNKVGLLCSLYLYRTGLSAPPEIFKALLARLHSAEERRNTILHSYWIKSPVCGVLTRYKYSAKSGKGFVHQIEGLEPEHIDAIAAQIATVNVDLDAHLTDTFPSCDGRAEMA